MLDKYILVSGNSVAEKSYELNILPEINGEINQDVESGLICQRPSGVALKKSVIGANGYLAAHRSLGAAGIQVLSGSGIVGIVDDDRNIKCEIRITAGDLIFFEKPMDMHYYEAGAEGLSYLVIDMTE